MNLVDTFSSIKDTAVFSPQKHPKLAILSGNTYWHSLCQYKTGINQLKVVLHLHIKQTNEKR